MTEHPHHAEEDLDKDPVWDLLLQGRQDPRPSPWFAVRTEAMARATPQSGTSSWKDVLRRLPRWILPIPIAGLACLAILTARHPKDRGSVTTAASLSEEAFEQHMNLLAGNDQNTEIDPLLTRP
jgi:hypothetical protein